jgi:hypothetical protein
LLAQVQQFSKRAVRGDRRGNWSGTITFRPVAGFVDALFTMSN